MGVKPGRYCCRFPCSALAVPGSAYCRTHQPARATKEADPFYLSPAWRRFRDWYIKNHPLCAMCEATGRSVVAEIVDHVVELRDGGAPFDGDNAQSLCRACHNAKTAQAKNHRESTRNNRAGSLGET